MYDLYSFGEALPSMFRATRRLGSPLLLVLDLDETLVRVCCTGVHHNRNLRVGAAYRSYITYMI